MSDKQIILDAADEIAELKNKIEHLKKIIRAREPVGHISVDTERGYQFIGGDLINDLMDGRHPVYLLDKDELDAAGILITPEVKLCD